MGVCIGAKRKPLKNKRILVTRPPEQAQAFVDLLEANGAVPVVFPTITIVPPRDWNELDSALANITTYNTIIFTSVNGVTFFFRRMRELGLENGALKSIRMCAIGPSTAAHIEHWGLQAHAVPEKFQAESVVEVLARESIAGKRFLLPRAEEARELLPEEIRKRGGEIDVVTAYRTESATSDGDKLEELLRRREIDIITFTSSSTVHHFVGLISRESLGSLIQGCAVACIGPITAQTVVSYGIIPEIIAEEYTIEGLIKAMVTYYSRIEENGMAE